MDIKKIIGERIKKERLEKDLNQPELAKKLSVAKGTVSNWENGYRSPDSEMLSKLANFFNVTTDYLLGRTDNPEALVYESNIDGDSYKVNIHKDYPYKLTPKQVEELILKLEKANFNIDKLIEEVKTETNEQDK